MELVTHLKYSVLRTIYNFELLKPLVIPGLKLLMFDSTRAGRDGEASKCILFYHYADMHRLRNQLLDTKLMAVCHSRGHFWRLNDVLSFFQRSIQKLKGGRGVKQEQKASDRRQQTCYIKTGFRKLIDMGEGDSNAKKTHYENLWQMVRQVFCAVQVIDIPLILTYLLVWLGFRDYTTGCKGQMLLIDFIKFDFIYSLCLNAWI